MRVLFLTLYPDEAASPRYRVTQFLPYLRAHGMTCDVACPLTLAEWRAFTGPGRKVRPFWYHAHETPRRIAQIMQGRRYDVVFVQKALTTAYVRGMTGLLRRFARRVVYDLDDAVHLDPPHPLRPPWSMFEDRAQILRLMAAADIVLAGNAWLAGEAQRAGARVVHFPTVVDTDRFVPAAQPPDQYRIGWIGTPSNLVCLEPALDALRAISDAELCLVGADPARNPFPNAEVRPWALDTEVGEIGRFSVGIMPQPEGAWMRGKCALKALLYMACGIPCIVSNTGAALEFVQDDVNGLIAGHPEEWRAALERLRDPVLRARLGDAGRATVITRYSLTQAAPRLLALLESLV